MTLRRWRIRIEPEAAKSLRKFSSDNRVRVLKFINERLARLDDPRSIGDGLTGSFTGLWRYRVGSIRVICRIIDDELQILVVEVGHRREIYGRR